MQGLELVDLEEPQECCGFGGTFAVKNADTSMAMLSDKLRRILDTRAEVCTAADNSCLMHIGGALRTPADRRARDAPGRDPGGDGMKGFPAAARESLAGLPAAPQPRQGDADDPRQAAAHDPELPDWEQLREAGAAIKARAMATLPEQLERLEAAVTRAGGTVHWARDGAEATAIVARIARARARAR